MNNSSYLLLIFLCYRRPVLQHQCRLLLLRPHNKLTQANHKAPNHQTALRQMKETVNTSPTQKEAVKVGWILPVKQANIKIQSAEFFNICLFSFMVQIFFSHLIQESQVIWAVPILSIIVRQYLFDNLSLAKLLVHPDWWRLNKPSFKILKKTNKCNSSQSFMKYLECLVKIKFNVVVFLLVFIKISCNHRLGDDAFWWRWWISQTGIELCFEIAGKLLQL